MSAPGRPPGLANGHEGRGEGRCGREERQRVEPEEDGPGGKEGGHVEHAPDEPGKPGTVDNALKSSPSLDGLKSLDRLSDLVLERLVRGLVSIREATTFGCLESPQSFPQLGKGPGFLRN